MTKRWTVFTPEATEGEDVGAENMSVSPAGALTFYDGPVLKVAYAPGAWMTVEWTR